MDTRQLAEKAQQLAAQAAEFLENWMQQYKEHALEPKEGQPPADLKEFVVYLTALKRAMEIVRLAAALAPGASDEQRPLFNPDDLRRLLAHES